MENNYQNQQQPQYYPPQNQNIPPQNPYGQPQPQYNAPPMDPNQMLIKEIKGTNGWLKFIGIVMYIIGGIMCLTLVGIVIAWIYIWMGITLTKAAKKGTEYMQTLSIFSLIEYNRKMKQYFTITGILTIIGLVFMLFYIVVLIILIATVSSMPEYFGRF